MITAAALLTVGVVLASCSSDSRTAASKTATSTAGAGAVHSATAVPSPSAAAAELRSQVGSAPAPKRVAGYAYGTPSVAAVQGAAAMSQPLKQLSTGRIVRGVETESGQTVDIVVVGVKAKYAGNKLFRAQLANSVVTGLAGAQPKLSDEIFGKRDVRIATGASAAVMGWFDGSHSVVAVVSYQGNLTQVRNVVKRYPGQGKAPTTVGSRSLGKPKIPVGGE